MIAPFVLHQPDSIEAAVSVLASYENEARLLAGGSYLVQALKLGVLRPTCLIDLKGISELHRIDFDATDRVVKVGPLATHRNLEQSPTIQEHLPLLAEMERQVGNVRLRNVGTLGGNLCAAHPRSDPATLLLAYNASLTVRSARGERTIEMADFLLDCHQTALERHELLVEIDIPEPSGRLSGRYLRFCPGEGPTVAVALLMGCEDGAFTDVRLAVCGGRTPTRLADVEHSLAGLTTDEVLAAARDAGELAARRCQPVNDSSGSVEYKRHIVSVLVGRALSEICRSRSGRD